MLARPRRIGNAVAHRDGAETSLTTHQRRVSGTLGLLSGSTPQEVQGAVGAFSGFGELAGHGQASAFWRNSLTSAIFTAAIFVVVSLAIRVFRR